MNEFQATTVMVALFALRCVLPLAFMVALGYAMNKLVDHWEAQEAAEREAKPAIPLPVVAPKRPAARQSPALSVPCWAFKNCDETSRARCPAFRNPSLACWVALIQAEGKLPAKCAGCERYTGAPAFAIGD